MKEPQYTSDGFERTIGTNHIGHFALLQGFPSNNIFFFNFRKCYILIFFPFPGLLNGKFKKNSNSRIVVVASGVHNPEEPGGDVGSKVIKIVLLSIRFAVKY